MILINESFHESALCCKLDVGPETFFSDDVSEMRTAQSICALCPVREECLDWAVSVERYEKFNWGIYGGLTPEDRRLLF